METQVLIQSLNEIIGWANVHGFKMRCYNDKLSKLAKALEEAEKLLASKDSIFEDAQRYLIKLKCEEFEKSHPTLCDKDHRVKMFEPIIRVINGWADKEDYVEAEKILKNFEHYICKD